MPRMSRLRRPLLLVGVLSLAAGCPKAETETPPPAKPADPPPAAAQPPPEPEAPKPDPVPPGPMTRKATRQEIETAIDQLSQWVKAGASEAGNPWAQAHGLLAFGPELKTEKGELVIDAIMAFAERETIGNRQVWVWPERTADGTPVAPHPNLMLKSMVEVGVPLDRKFKMPGGKRATLRQLVDGAAWAFEMPTSDEDWRQFAWSLGLFLEVYGKKGVVKTHDGDIPVSRLAQQAVAKLENEQAFLLTPMTRGRPDLVQKRRQDIYAHSCGGLHFVQGGLHAAGIIEDKNLLFRATKQLEIVAFRWDAERRIYRETIRQQPKYRALLLIQELKFHGHVLETLALAPEWGVGEADEATRELAAKVAGDLIDAIYELRPMYEKHQAVKKAALAGRPEIRKAGLQTYYDLTGDGCHAIRGLRQALVAFFPPPSSP